MKRICIFILFALMIFTACQPTPEVEPIINRTDDYEDKKTMTVEGPQSVMGEEQGELRIDEEYTTPRGVPITIHATVAAPEEATVPILRVQTKRFTKEQILHWIDVLGEGAVLCEQPKDPFSREYYAECIQREQEAIERETDEKKIEEYRETLEFYRNAYNKAKPESEIDRDRPFDIGKIEEKNNFSIVLRKEGETVGTVIVTDYDDDVSRYVFEYVPAGPRRTYTGDLPLSDPSTSSMTFTERDAIEEAIAFMERLGIPDMEHAYTEIMFRYEGTRIDGRPEAYRLFFTRTVDGIPKPFYWIKTWQLGYQEQDRQEYRPAWTPEYIDITVDAEGITDFRWQNPVEIVETVNENVAVVPFDQARQAFDSYMDILRSAGDYMDGDATVEITDILFGYDFFPVKDSLCTFDMVPCWFFLGYDKESRLMHTRGAQLILNAVDGKLPIS